MNTSVLGFLLLVLFVGCFCLYEYVTHYYFRTLRVAVIGAGIGGASFAHYLSKSLETSDLQIDVYEANLHVGGR